MPDHDPSVPKLAGILLVLTAIGFPMIGYLWETLNEVMAGEFDARRIVISVPILLVFAAFVWVVAKWTSRFHAAEVDRKA